MFKKIFFIFLYHLLFLTGIKSQVDSLNNQRYTLITIKNDTKFSDNQTIDPNSLIFKVKNGTIDSFNVQINNNELKIVRKSPSNDANIDSIEIHYRVFSFNLGRKFTLIDSSMSQFEDQVIYIDSKKNRAKDKNGLIASENLNYSGSFSRGLSFGNSQDLVLNSNLNLQLNGDLGNGLFIKAAISDEDIPIQPQGNTQILQEFDKVFVEIKKNNTKLIAGDYELSNPKNYFTRYYKKLKGLSIENQHNISDNWEIINKSSYAISRGKFARVNLVVSEGNQGPYQLRTESTNRFIIVLSGTEKVYLDGRLLKRGLDNDYLIDYNRGEISFTSNILINKNSRIIVEYEFSDQNYLRSLYAVNSQLKSKRWTFDLNVYNEQDSKSSTGNIELDSIDLTRLQEAGDDLNSAFRSSLNPSSEINGDQIKYRLVFEASISDSILVFDPNFTGPTYTASFTDVGQGNGSYEIDSNQALNGRVYIYVGPNQGSYVALVRLTPPESKHLSTFGVGYQLGSNTHLQTEFAISSLDINRFSSLNNEDNTGTGLRLKITDKRGLDTLQKFSLATNISLESKGENFNAINPYRTPEFTRDWNYLSVPGVSEDLAVAEFELSLLKIAALNYAFNYFAADSLYTGNKNVLGLRLNLNGWNFDGEVDYLQAENTIHKIKFLRPNLSLQKSFSEDLLSFKIERLEEKNTTRHLITDELIMANADFDSYKFTIETQATEDIKLGISALRRMNYGIDQGQRLNSAKVIEYAFYGFHNKDRLSQLNWNFVLRDFEVLQNNIENESSKKTILVRLNHKLNLFKNGLQVSTTFENNSGQEPKLEEQFIEVQKGEGRFIWLDNAPNDSIQQINEFVIAPFADQGNYQKISLFNNEFIGITKTILNQSLKITPEKWINPEKQKTALLSKLSWISRYRIDQKLEQNTGSAGFEFLNFNAQDSSIISYLGSFDHSLFINRGKPVFDGSIGKRQLRSKLAYISGNEDYIRNEEYTRWRWTLKRKTDILFEGSLGTEKNTSQINQSNNSSINFYALEPSISYRPSNNFRISLEYSLTKKDNELGTEKSTSNDLGFEINWRKASDSFLSGAFHLVNIDYTGSENSQIELRMLEGLKKGANYLWNFNFTKRLSNSIDMIINYDGRKTGTNRTVHVFTTEIKANF